MEVIIKYHNFKHSFVYIICYVNGKYYRITTYCNVMEFDGIRRVIFKNGKFYEIIENNTDNMKSIEKYEEILLSLPSLYIGETNYDIRKIIHHQRIVKSKKVLLWT